jgi:phasin family protein
MFPPLPSPAFRSHFDNLLDLYVGTALCMFEASRSLSEMNMQLCRDLIAEAGANTRRLMASKDASELGSALSAQLTPGMQALSNYQRRAAEQLARFQPGSQLRH